MQLILVAPGLLAQSQAALAATSSLASLAQLGATAHLHASGIAAALIDALGAPADTPIAPLAALGASIDAGPITCSRRIRCCWPRIATI